MRTSWRKPCEINLDRRNIRDIRRAVYGIIGGRPGVRSSGTAEGMSDDYRGTDRIWLATLARSSLTELRIRDWIPPPPSPA